MTYEIGFYEEGLGPTVPLYYPGGGRVRVRTLRHATAYLDAHVGLGQGVAQDSEGRVWVEVTQGEWLCETTGETQGPEKSRRAEAAQTREE